MDVGKLGDAKALKGFGQACQADALTNDFYVLPLVEKPIARGDEGSGTDEHSGPLQKATAAGRLQGGFGICSGGVPVYSRPPFPVNPPSGAGRPVCPPKAITSRKANSDPTNHHEYAAKISLLCGR